MEQEKEIFNKTDEKSLNKKQEIIMEHEKKENIIVGVAIAIFIIIVIAIAIFSAIKEKISTEEKKVAIAFNDVLGEVESIKSPKLQDAWCNEKDEVVLYIRSSSLSFNFYICAIFSEDTQKYEYYCAAFDPISEYTVLVDFSNMNISSNVAESTRKVIVNRFNRIMKDENKLEKSSINHINDLIDNGKIKDIKLK